MIPCCIPWTWKLCDVKPTEKEDNILDTSRPMVPRDKLLRSYVVWRRAALIFLFPLVLVDTAMEILLLCQEVELLNSLFIKLRILGWLLKVSQAALSPLTQLIGTTFALWQWTNIKLSQKIFNVAIALSLILQFWPAFVRLDTIYSYDVVRFETIEDFYVLLETKLEFKNGFAVWLPFFLAIPSGSVRGARNIMGLVNDSAVPGCLVLLLTPFGILIYLAIFTSVLQIYGHWLLALGVILLVLSKLKVFYYRSLYISGDVKEISKQRVGLKGLVLLLGGFACIGVWAFTTEYRDTTIWEKFFEDKTVLDYVTFVHSWFTKVCLYALIFSDIVLHIMLNCEGDRQWSCRGIRNFYY